jgi:hypothetical protein
MMGALVLATYLMSQTGPPAVTVEWLTGVAEGRYTLASLVDPERGVAVLVHQLDSGREDFEGVLSARRVCAADLAAIEKSAADYLRHVLVTGEHVECQNRPGLPTCRYKVANEYTSEGRLVFRPAADGSLRLEALLSLDGGSVGYDFKADQERWVRRQLARLAPIDCRGR